MVRLLTSVLALFLLPTPAPAQTDAPSPLVAALDADGDGVLVASELPAEARRVLLRALDGDEDGALSAEELDTIGKGGAGRGRKTRRGPDNWDFAEETRNGIRIVRNLAYATGADYAGGRGKLDVYIPAGDGPHPVILFFHGGGLYNGDKATLVALGPRFAALGYLVAAPNYRLSPEYAYPAYVEDAALAFRWVWDHIRDHGGDPERIAVSGGSAGGHIAALLSVDERYLRARDLDFGHIRASLPITVADGDTENRRTQNVEMFDAMKEAGAEVEFEWLVDRTHNSILPNMIKEGDRTVELLLDFLRRHGMAP